MKISRLDLSVGAFVLAGLLAIAWLAVKVGGGALVGPDTYTVKARFANSGGLTENGADSGVPGTEGLLSVADSAHPFAPWTSPLDVERFVHEAPPEGLFSEAAAGPTAAGHR